MNNILANIISTFVTFLLFKSNSNPQKDAIHNAKNNIIGKQQFITETNSQQANLMAYYAISGRNFDYQKDIVEKLKRVTAQELMDCANKYFTNDYALAILKP